MKSVRKLFYNQRGFSLVEVMIAAGMLGIISAGVMQMISNMQKGQKNIAQQAEKESIVYEARLALRDRTACRRTFAAGFGIPVPPNPPLVPGTNINTAAVDPTGSQLTPGTSWVAGTSTDSIYSAQGKKIVSVGDIIGQGTQGRMQLSRVDIFGHSGAPNDGVSPDQGTVRLTFLKQSSQEMTTGSQSTTQDFTVQFVIDGANQVVDCFVDEAQYVTAACDSLGGGLAGSSCHNLRIGDNGNIAPVPDVHVTNQLPFALRLDGDLLIGGGVNGSGSGGATGGAIGVGRNPTRPGSVDIQGSVGIGLNSPAQDGTLQTSANLAVGSMIGAMPTGSGNAHIGFNLLVGVGAGAVMPTGSGNAHIHNDLVVGNSITIPDNGSYVQAAWDDLLTIGDNARLTDIDINNTLAIEGVQDPTVASLKFGNNTSPLISGAGAALGINTTSPTTTNSTIFHVNGNSYYTGDIKVGDFANSRGMFKLDQGGSLELGGTVGLQRPYIDFSNDMAIDSDIRLQLMSDDVLRLAGGHMELYEDRQGSAVYSKVVTEEFIKNLVVTSVNTTAWEELIRAVLDAIWAATEDDVGETIANYVCSRITMNRTPDVHASSVAGSWNSISNLCTLNDAHDDVPEINCGPDLFLTGGGSSAAAWTCERIPTISNSPTTFTWVGVAEIDVSICIELMSQHDGDIKCARRRVFCQYGFTCTGACSGSAGCTPASCGGGWNTAVGDTFVCDCSSNNFASRDCNSVEGTYFVATGGIDCASTGLLCQNFRYRECIREADNFRAD